MYIHLLYCNTRTVLVYNIITYPSINVFKMSGCSVKNLIVTGAGPPSALLLFLNRKLNIWATSFWAYQTHQNNHWHQTHQYNRIPRILKALSVLIIVTIYHLQIVRLRAFQSVRVLRDSQLQITCKSPHKEHKEGPYNITKNREWVQNNKTHHRHRAWTLSTTMSVKLYQPPIYSPVSTVSCADPTFFKALSSRLSSRTTIQLWRAFVSSCGFFTRPNRPENAINYIKIKKRIFFSSFWNNSTQ